MSDTIEALLSRTRQLEEENALLRALQPSAQTTAPANPKEPKPSEAPLSKPRDLSPWDSATPAAPPAAPVPTATEVLMPRTLQEFRALPADRRAAAALAMTRRQRDELLGRCPAGSEGYL